MKLYTYWRSSAAYRVRIALNLKGITAEQVPVHLVRDGGEQRKPEYLALNPQGRVPLLVDGTTVIPQSLAMIEYLDEIHPTPPLLPIDPAERARVRSLADLIACDVHPVCNLSVMQYLERELGVDADGKEAWMRHWIGAGLTAFEARVALDEDTGEFCHGDAPTLADVILVPQLYNARRVGLDLAPFPTLTRIDEACRALDAFAEAAPERQADAQ